MDFVFPLSEEQRAKLEEDINCINEEYIGDEAFEDISNLALKLDRLKTLFMKYDYACKGELDYVGFHALARELRIYTTLAEQKRRVQEITGNTRNVLSYKDTAMAVLGRRSTVCQRIMKPNGENGDFDKKPCWLDCSNAAYVGYVEFAALSLRSPITPLPPPPPPSPVDVSNGDG